MSDSTTGDRHHVADLVEDAKVALPTTTTADGTRVRRPLGLQEAEFDGDLWFLADEDSAKVAQISAMPQVDVALCDDKGPIAGRARVVRDRRNAEELPPSVLTAWFPDGLETPGLTLIEVDDDTAAHWHAPTSTAAFAAGDLRAAVTGTPKKDPVINATVEL